MRRTFSALAASLLLAAVAQVGAMAAEPPRSGHAVFDRAVRLVMDNFHDTAALDRFAETVRREIGDPQSPIDAAASNARVDAAIDAVLASLHASHTARLRPDTIDYFEIADVFRYAIRDDMRRLFPPEGNVTYPGIGMIVRPLDGSLFVSDVYDGSPAAKAGILAGDEIVSVDGAPTARSGRFATRSAGASISDCGAAGMQSRWSSGCRWRD